MKAIDFVRRFLRLYYKELFTKKTLINEHLEDLVEDAIQVLSTEDKRIIKQAQEKIRKKVRKELGLK